jgi:hypothetical protein
MTERYKTRGEYQARTKTLWCNEGFIQHSLEGWWMGAGELVRAVNRELGQHVEHSHQDRED